MHGQPQLSAGWKRLRLRVIRCGCSGGLHGNQRLVVRVELLQAVRDILGNPWAGVALVRGIIRTICIYKYIYMYVCMFICCMYVSYIYIT